MPVRGCESRRVMAEESSAVWGVAVWCGATPSPPQLSPASYRPAAKGRVVGEGHTVKPSSETAANSQTAPANAAAAAAAAFYYAVYYSARLRTPAVCLRGQYCRPSIRRELSYHGLYLSASTQPIMTLVSRLVHGDIAMTASTHLSYY